MATVKSILHDIEEQMKKSVEATHREFSEIRTGRASPSLVEGIRVEYYGAPLPLKQIASITIPDARLIVIQPWDKSILGEIERAILKSDLGVNPTCDGKLIRINIPQLSQERREELAKIVKKMAEEGRVSLRTIRRDAKEEIEKLEKDKHITEDEKFKGIDDLDKLTNNYIKKIDEILANKEKELIQM